MSGLTGREPHPRARRVYELLLPHTWISDRAFMDVRKAGNKTDGHQYELVTFSEGTFTSRWLTEEERRGLIEALGGTP